MTNYKQFLETLPDCVVVFDLEGRMLEANQQAAETYGCASVEELLSSGKTAFDVIDPTDLERTAGTMQEALSQGVMKNIEYNLLRVDGSSYPAEISVSVTQDENGDPTGFVSVFRDISERKRMQAALEETEAKYSAVVEQAKDIVAITAGWALQEGTYKPCKHEE